MTRLRGTLMAAAVPLLLLGACAQPAATGAPGVSGSPSATLPGADTLVLRTESFGGFVPVDRVVGVLPAVSVYGDGRVITNGPVPAVYPGPALPNVQVQMVAPELVQELTREAVAAGVRTGTDYGQPNVADAPTTRVTAVTAEGTQTVVAEALSESQETDPRLTPEQQAARKRLAAFVARLTDLPTAEGMPTPVAYAPVAVAVLARPFSAPGRDLPKNPEKAWPGPALPGPILNQNSGTGCVVVTGVEKDGVLAAARTATAITPWTSGGARWLIVFRPLLPDEKGCVALKGDR